MREVFTMWKNTRMVVLTALSASIYATILIPFKSIPLIPGFTELRPASVLPVVCSFMFGPAGAWGAAFGNLIGDFFGTLGPGSIFGFFGNFLYGFIPYKMWRSLSRREPVPRGAKEILKYIALVFLASAVCGVVIGWGVDILGLVPFSALGNIITLNDFIVSAILGPFLLLILYPRVKQWGLLYTDVLEPDEIPRPLHRGLGAGLMWIGGLGGLLMGNLISVGVYKSGLFAVGFTEGIKGTLGLGLGLLPAIVLILLGALLL